MLLTMENWKGVWLGAVILSQKLWSDNPMNTAGFAALVPTVMDSQLRTVESKFFSLIRMVTSVKPSQYAEVRGRRQRKMKKETGFSVPIMFPHSIHVPFLRILLSFDIVPHCLLDGL
jgi:hypothetical protein